MKPLILNDKATLLLAFSGVLFVISILWAVGQSDLRDRSGEIDKDLTALIKTGTIPQPVNGEWHIIILTSPFCSYCIDNVDLYDAITDRYIGDHNVKLYAVLADSGMYNLQNKVFHTAGVDIDDLIIFDMSKYRVTSVPGIIVTDGRMQVVRYWKGFLNQDLYDSVIAELERVTSS